jgi:hypothetical protein
MKTAASRNKQAETRAAVHLQSDDYAHCPAKSDEFEQSGGERKQAECRGAGKHRGKEYRISFSSWPTISGGEVWPEIKYAL